MLFLSRLLFQQIGYNMSDTLTLVKGGGSCLLMAFPEGHRYFCSSRIRPEAGEGVLLTAGCEPGVLLKDGQSLAGEPFVLRSGPSWQALAEEWASDKERLLCGSRKKKKTPSVFCTWYYYGLTVSYKDAAENLEKIRERRLPYDVFQIDEGWEITLGEWEPNAKFPLPMKEAAARIREAGLIPGIWTSPFIAHESAGFWKKHPGWKLRGKDGEPVLFPMNSTVYQVLDITIPKVRDYVEDLYRKLTEDWGYVYHKLDFTRAAVIYEDADRFDKTLALPEAYRLAMEAVRRGIGSDSYLLVCGGLYDACIGIADAQRTGSDVLSMWKKDDEKDGKTVPYTVKQNLLRWYMGEGWDNDADCLMLRENRVMERGTRLTLGLLSDCEIRILLLNQYLSGGLFSQTEPLSRISDSRLMEIRRLLPLRRIRVCADLFSGERFPSRVQIREKAGTDPFRQAAFFNWSDEETVRPLAESLEKWFDLPEKWKGERLLLTEYYHRRWRILRSDEGAELPALGPHDAELVRLQVYREDRPYVVGSDAHFAMGEEVSELSVREDVLVFRVNNPVTAPVFYDILLPEGYRDSKGGQVIRIDVPGQGDFMTSVPLYRTGRS